MRNIGNAIRKLWQLLLGVRMTVTESSWRRRTAPTRRPDQMMLDDAQCGWPRDLFDMVGVGALGVGCVCCARLRESHLDQAEEDRRSGKARQKADKQGAQYANTKWAKFEISQASQIAVRGVRQHEQTLQHRKAVRAMSAPPEARELIMMDVGDTELFRAAVPQHQRDICVV